eukprot:910127-Prorocentrum_minimum.AAC.1
MKLPTGIGTGCGDATPAGAEDTPSHRPGEEPRGGLPRESGGNQTGGDLGDLARWTHGAGARPACTARRAHCGPGGGGRHLRCRPRAPAG